MNFLLVTAAEKTRLLLKMLKEDPAKKDLSVFLRVQKTSSCETAAARKLSFSPKSTRLQQRFWYEVPLPRAL